MLRIRSEAMIAGSIIRLEEEARIEAITVLEMIDNITANKCRPSKVRARDMISTRTIISTNTLVANLSPPGTTTRATKPPVSTIRQPTTTRLATSPRPSHITGKILLMQSLLRARRRVRKTTCQPRGSIQAKRPPRIGTIVTIEGTFSRERERHLARMVPLLRTMRTKKTPHPHPKRQPRAALGGEERTTSKMQAKVTVRPKSEKVRPAENNFKQWEQENNRKN